MYLRRIKDLREDADKTQAEIAQILECNIRTYRNYETGRSEITLKRLLLLMEYYSTDANYILGLTNDYIECKASSYLWEPKRLVYLRRKHHWSQKQLANLLNTEESSYRRYELGTRFPPPSTIVKLASLMETNANYVLNLHFHYTK